jgi:hypothetical protein
MGRSTPFLNRAHLLLAVALIATTTVALAEDARAENERKAPPRLAVRPSTPGNLTPLEELVAGIDNRIESTALDNGVAPAPKCDDSTFLRRVSLDLAGEIPSADEAAAFARSNDPRKRLVKVQELLKSNAYADRWAVFWTGALVNPRDDIYGNYYSKILHNWLFNELRSERGMDTIAHELLTSTGTPPATYLGYRLFRTGVPKTADHLSRTFLGARIGCAQCHDHPFDKYTQNDFWGFASFIAYTQSNFTNVSDSDVRSSGEINEPPSSDYVLAARYLDGTVFDPAQAEPPQPPVKPNQNMPMGRMPGNATVIPGRPVQFTSRGANLRHTLADLILKRDDLRFDRAIANRMWATLLGRGLIHPVDDIRIQNTSEYESQSFGAHDDILNLIAADFRASGRDLRRLLTLITATQAYQRASTTTATQRERDNAVRYFVQADIRPMTPEMFHLAVARISSGEERYLSQQRVRYDDYLRGNREIRRNHTDYESGLNRFYMNNNSAGDETPIFMEPTFSRALTAMNGDYIQRAAQDGANRLKQRNRASLEQIFATVLSRPITPQEYAAFQKLGEKYEAIFWVLFNTSEFSSIR